VKTDGHPQAEWPYGGTALDGGNVKEADETNNVGSGSVVLAIPDLTIGEVSIGAVVVHQNGTFTIPVTYTVTNIGTVAAQPGWSERAYLSVDGVLGVDDQVLGGYHYQGQPLAAGASYTRTVEYTATSATAPGSYTVFVKTDGHPQAEWPYGGTALDGGNVKEADETNNVGSVGVVLVK